MPGESEQLTLDPMNPPVSFQVNDPATYTIYSDSLAGHIVSVSPNGKTVVFQYGKATLLNGFDSGEPDALVCHPGGFCGHVEGKQRWKVEVDPQGAKSKFTLRGNGQWKAAGHSTRSPGCILGKGHFHHYDYNF